MSFFSKIWKKVTGWLKPKLNEQEKGFDIEKSGTNQPIPVYYGKYKEAPCVKVFKMNSDKKGGAKNEYLHLICVICEGEIGAFGNVYFDGISESAINSERYYIEKHTGSDTQPHSAELTNQLSMWKDTATLSGVAYLYIRLRQNKKVDWWLGEPKITVDIAQGKLVTDLRIMQRKYSSNLALCTYDYLVNARCGKGLPPSELDIQSFIAEANYTEIQRTYMRTVYVREWDAESNTWLTTPTSVNETVSEDLFGCNVKIDTDKSVKENIEILLKGARAILPESDGQYRYVIEKEADVAFAFTADDLHGSVISDGGSQNERYNQVIIKFRNKLTGVMDEVVYPESDELHQLWLSEDNNKLLLGEFTIETIDNKAEALQMGHVITKRSRQDIRAQWVGMPWTIACEPGDVISLPSTINGWVAKPFRIESAEPDLDTGLVKFQGIEHQNTIYPWSVTETTEEYTDTSFYLPNTIIPPTGLNFSAAPDDSDIFGVLAWADPNDVMVVGHVVEITNTDSGGIVFSQETTQHRIDIPRLPKGSYLAEVFARNSLFISAPTALTLTAVAPKVPNGLTVSAGNFELILTPTIDGAPGTLLFDLKVSADTNIENSTLLGRARSFTDNNLAPNTERYYWARSINATSESAWSEMFVGKTTIDDTSLLEVLGGLEQSNFTSEVNDLLDQVKNISVSDPLPVLIDNILADIENAKNAISTVRLDETKITDLQANHQQLGIDFISLKGDTSAAFSQMVDKLADTDQFVLDINQKLGEILVEGGQVSYDQFINYKLLVDTLNGSLSSLVQQVTNSSTGLNAAHSKIDQNINSINLLLGDTDVADLLTTIKQVSFNVDRLDNTLTQQSFSAQFDEWAQFEQSLNSELQITNLLENNIDFALVQEKNQSDIDETKAEASSSKLLIATLNEDLKKSLSTLASNEHVLSTAQRTSAEVTKKLLSTIDDETSARESAISATQQTVTDEASTRATAVAQLNSKIEDETSARESAISATQQTVADESSTRATQIQELSSTITDPLTGLQKAHSEIDNTQQTLASEVNNRTQAIQSLSSRVENEEQATTAANLILNAFSDDIEGLKAQVFLGVDVDGRIAGIYINGSNQLSEIELKSDKISFVNPETDLKDLLYSAAKKRLVFGGIISAGSLIQSPKIEYIGTTHMRISAAQGFGSQNQFIEWFGLKIMQGAEINYSALTEANAITYLKTDGSAYFGGSIISGTLSNSLTTSSLSRTAEVQIGPFGSNGGTIAINCSVAMNSHYSKLQSSTVSAPSAPSCTILLEEFVSGNWLTRQSASYQGTSSASNEYEGNGQYATQANQQLSGSFTYTDNKNTIADRQYRVRLVTRTNLLTLGDWSATQRLSINSQEG